ncbi:PIR Superfamily Protein [Plasmodium ovale curtisi]|uniref:PIR Superfamily Protein n=1 Tax=Plasmodium ovale curtisi TaxID=864141 RepID=A0A1A8XBY4_PLAOA|nr:PIR Superfamily Protein [Plasmodium ovale curtisi]
MVVEVSFRGDSQRKSCMDEFIDIDPNDDKKIEDVNKTNEEDGTFLQKCHDLRKYLETYNVKYKHCFNGETAALFLSNRDLIYAALVKCTKYEERQAELKRREEKQVATPDELGKHTAEEGSAKLALLGEEKSEGIADCRNEKCKSKEMENQKQPVREGMHKGESKSRKEQATSVPLQELETETNSLSTDQELLGNKAHSSDSHTQEDPPLIGSANLGSPKSVEGVTQPDDSLQGNPVTNSDPNVISDVNGLACNKFLLTNSPDDCVMASDPGKPSSSLNTTLMQHSVDQVDLAKLTSKVSVAGALSSENPGKELSPGKSPQVADLTPASSSLTAAGEYPSGFPSSSEMSSFINKSISSVTSSSVEESRSNERTSSSHRLSDGVVLPASQHSSDSQKILPSQPLPQSQHLTTEGQLLSEKHVSSQTEFPVRISHLSHNCIPDKMTCDSNHKTLQQDLNNMNLPNNLSGEQSTVGRIDTSKASTDSRENNINIEDIKSSLHTESEKISIKTYIIIILVVLAIILLSLLLFKYACLRGYFSKKRKKKRQRIQDELDRIMYSPSIFDEHNMYLPYVRLENSYYYNTHENDTSTEKI